MPIFKYSDPGGIEEPATLVTLSERIRFGDVTLTNAASVGDVGNSTQYIDDPEGELDLQGLRAFHVYETSAPSNNQMIGRFVIQDRTVARNPERSAITGPGRVWNVDLSDYNWHLGKRILTDQDSNRPAETIGDRLRWLINRAAHINLNDYGHVVYPSRQMEPNDYRLQRPIDVLNDCCIEDNYNFWVDYNEAHGRPELFFIDPSSTDYEADIATSNDPADVDNLSIFFPSKDASLNRSPSRIAFGAAVAYTKGFEYRRKDSTGQQFGKLDQVAPMENVKSAARAGRLAQKFVNDHDEETDVLEWDLLLPIAQVNDVRHGQLMAVKFVHLPGYEDYVGVRILERTVMSDATIGSLHYRVHLKATKPSAPASEIDPPEAPYNASAFAAMLRIQDHDGTSGTFTWNDTGDTPSGGWYHEPSVGPISVVQGSAPYSSITTSEEMLARVECRVGVSSAVVGPQSVTMTVRRNGVAIGTDTASTSTPGAHSFVATLYVDLNNVELAASDVINVTFTATTNLFYTGGSNLTYLRVGRGTHVWNDGDVIWTGP